MPFLAALGPILPFLTAGATLAGTGFGIANAVSQPGQPAAAPPPTAAQNVAAEVDKRRQEATLVNQQIPGIDANTSGSLSGLSDQTFGSAQAGVPGAFGQGGMDLNGLLQMLNPSLAGGASTNLMSLAGGSIT